MFRPKFNKISINRITCKNFVLFILFLKYFFNESVSLHIKKEIKNETNLLKAPYKNKMAVNQVAISTFKLKLTVLLTPKSFNFEIKQHFIKGLIIKSMILFQKLDVNTVPLYKITSFLNFKNFTTIGNLKKKF